MSVRSMAFPDPPVGDLGKSAAAGLKTAAAEEEEVVDTRKAALIRCSLEVFFVVYLLFYIGIMVAVSDNWWDPWPGVVLLSPICIGTLWLTPQMKGVYVLLHATKRRMPGSAAK